MALDALLLRNAVSMAEGESDQLTSEQKVLAGERSELRKEGFEIDSQKGANEDAGTLTEVQRARLAEINKRIAEIDSVLKGVKIKIGEDSGIEQALAEAKARNSLSKLNK